MSLYRFLFVVVLMSLAGPARASGKVALIVGNGDYTHASDLPQARADARSVAETLTSLGFQVTLEEDTTGATLQRAVAAFQVALRGADVGFFYYAGHGVQVDGENYLVPIDAALPDPAYTDAEAVRADRVLAAMDAAGASLNVVVLDACRNNPFVRSWAAGTRAFGDRGLDPLTAPTDRGFLLALATDPGNVALDSGVYARALTTRLRAPCADITRVFADVRDDVVRETGGAQRPWLNDGAGAAGRAFYPGGCDDPPDVRAATPPQAAGKDPQLPWVLRGLWDLLGFINELYSRVMMLVGMMLVGMWAAAVLVGSTRSKSS